MYFKTDYIYHICNRGNNQEKVFFNEENYLFFLKKVRKELTGYFHFLAYCLMPNHFHFLVQVKHSSDDFVRTNSSDDFKSSDEYSKEISMKIATLLRSYTRAINIQENRTGSLFQQKSKAKCLNDYSTSQLNYVSACFHYIHHNPKNSGLVNNLEDWRFSSFLDYSGIRQGTLCNKELAFQIINFDKENFIDQSNAILNEKNLKGIWL